MTVYMMELEENDNKTKTVLVFETEKTKKPFLNKTVYYLNKTVYDLNKMVEKTVSE